jgi:hypothetical protein
MKRFPQSPRAESAKQLVDRLQTTGTSK